MHFLRLLGITFPTQPKTSTKMTNMAEQSNKRQKREIYRATLGNTENATVQLPRKRYYRQRAHANVFSDHEME
jgi:hypothetical protein